MKMLHTSTAIGLMLGLASTAGAADTKTQGQQNQQQQAQQSQQTQAQQSQQTQAGQDEQMAQGQQDQGQRGFHPIDVDDDGQVSAEEASRHAERMFGALDQNRDNSITREEVGGYTAVHPGYVVVRQIVPVALVRDVEGMRTQQFSQLDQDQSGDVSRQEFMAYGEQAYRQAAQQSGGQLGTQDYSQMTGWRADEATSADRNQDSRISQDEAAADFDRQFSALDRDGNGKLSQDEWQSPAQQAGQLEQQFSELDANGDGKVDQEEFAKAGEQYYQSADINQDQKVSPWEYRTGTN